MVSYGVYNVPKKLMHQMHGIIPFMFDYWADPVVDEQLKALLLGK